MTDEESSLNKPTLQSLYIVSVEMSSGHNQESSEDITDYRRETTFTFSKDERKKIAAIRMKHKTPIYRSCVPFHTIWICKHDQIPVIMDRVSQAHRDLNVVDHRLTASAEFIELMSGSMLKGEQYFRVINAIKYRVFKEVFDRISEVANNKTFQKNGTLNDRTRNSLVNLCQQLATLNILNDEEITARIADIQAKIEKDSIQPLIDEMKIAIEGVKVQSRWTALKPTTEQTSPG